VLSFLLFQAGLGKSGLVVSSKRNVRDLAIFKDTVLKERNEKVATYKTVS